MRALWLPAALPLFALLPGASSSMTAAKLTLETDAAKNRPVSKVITLLRDMLKQLEKEAEQDEEIYDKLACWCETNDKEKTKSIAEAEDRIEDLTTTIEKTTALSARLGSEVKNLEKEVAKNQESLAQATALREKQLAEFNAEEKDLLGSISALQSALTVLGKHQGDSLLQVSRSHAFNIATMLRKTMQKHSELLKGVIPPSHRRAVYSFIQSPSYAPQSSEIFGILGQMKETFDANLAASQKEEAENQKAYSELKAAKEEEIKAGQEQADKKTEELADTDEKKAQAGTDLKDTKKSLAADEEFMMVLKEKCQMTDKEWEERQKTRQLEMEAVSKALSVLSGDDAHDLFSKTFNPAFLQTQSRALSERRKAAAKVLAVTAAKWHNPRLSNLAYSVRLDAFTRVKKAMDDLVQQMLKEKEDEIKHKDFCTDEFNTNQLETEQKTRDNKDLDAQVSELASRIKALGSVIDTLKAEISEMQVQLKRAGEDREKQNQEFQTTVADQRATQKLLKSALIVLQDFYGKQAAAAAAFAQQDSADSPPPPGFEEYKKNAASGGVMNMIEQIISDAKAMEAEAIRSEEDAQKAYEDFVKETNISIETKSKDIVSKSETKAKAEDDYVEAKKAKDSVVIELEQLANYKAELHQSCDFVLDNFDLRQTARDEEVEALRQAKAILSGAKFDSFLQMS